MRHLLTYSKKEKTARQLWSQFNRQDQEVFWQQYEQLIVKNARQFTPPQAPPRSLATKPKTTVIQSRSFHNPLFPYRARLVFLTVSLGLMGILLVGAFFSAEHRAALIFLATLVLFFTIRPLWYFTSFHTSNQGLLVLRDMMLHKKSFAWDKIHLIQLYRDQYNTTYIKVWLRSNEQTYFKYPLVGRNHHDFLQVLEDKNISIENKL